MSNVKVSMSTKHTVHALKGMTVAVLMMFGFAAFANCNAGCALFDGKQAQTPEQTLEHNYTTDIVACAATAGFPGAYDRDADMRCRDDVNRRYGIGGPDAGSR